MIITYPSGSSSLQRPGRPCRWLLQPQRWGSCRAPGRAPQPSWRYRWPPFAPVWAGPGLSRSGTWSLRWWWGPRWSPVPSGSVWSTCQSPSWRSERRRRSLWREEEGRKCVKWSEVKEMWLYLAFFPLAAESLTSTVKLEKRKCTSCASFTSMNRIFSSIKP